MTNCHMILSPLFSPTLYELNITSITGVNASDKTYFRKIYSVVFDFVKLFLKYLVKGLHYEICSVHLCSGFFITRVWQFNLSDMFMFNTPV